MRTFIFAILFTLALGAQAATYHVDAESGDDSADGLGPDTAWASLAPANAHVFQPGDALRFKAGTHYAGELRPQGAGSEDAPFTIGAYGEGPRPRIDGEGATLQTVALYNTTYVELSGLEITNTGAEREARRCGVRLRLNDYGTARGIVLRDLVIRDVNGSLVKREGGGDAIKIENRGRRVRSRFDGLLIEDCHFLRCARNGITMDGYWRRDNWYPNLNLIIRRNLLEGIPGDGIVPNATEGALVEHNVMRDCPRLLPEGDAAAGIWPWSSDNTVIQYNEVSDHKAPWDAQGFDSDYNCRNTLIQYNYSHDNEGGFLLVCNNGESGMPYNIGNTGTVIRYNISVNDGLRATGEHSGFSPVFHISGPVKDTQIYNNTIIIPEKPGPEVERVVVRMDNWGGPWPDNTVFENNLFIVDGESSFIWGDAEGTRFSHNVFSGEFLNPPDDPHGVYADPGFLDPPGTRAPRNALIGYRPSAASPLIGAGTPIQDNGGKDFFGNPVANPPAIGAIQPTE